MDRRSVVSSASPDDDIPSSPKWITEYSKLGVSDDEDDNCDLLNESESTSSNNANTAGDDDERTFRRRTTRLESVRRPPAAVRKAARRPRPVTVADRATLLALLARDFPAHDNSDASVTHAK